MPAARENLENRYPGIQVVGTYSPPLGFENDAEELRRIDDYICRAQPDILVVCLGCPKQSAQEQLLILLPAALDVLQNGCPIVEWNGYTVRFKNPDDLHVAIGMISFS